ncbi:DEAD/DEAH box helicase [Fusibacter bizertensis]|uniref:DEAD/DEAH box helicase n=1 Tax=Fusibacter bizertensis TaxID=1488331 RepID=A0ABT6NAM1_9FIRM|nr:DEAD/DEAH box helicase [Fusibacter bizertensis]MDH8677463.1 DEAD/DEAH box helicase [Fusibacter bizertensis]
MSNFLNMNIENWLLEALKKQHILKPTEIQEHTIPLIIEGRDIIARAPTGTGKTLAYLLSTLDKMDKGAKDVQMLILSPTRELAIQIADEVNKLIKDTELVMLPIYGGVDTHNQIKKLDRGVNVIVATPGRLIDLMKQSIIKLDHLKIMVIDEADQMLLLGFKNEVEFILSAAKARKQTLCFSATLDRNVKKLAYKHMSDPVEVMASGEAIVLDNIDQKLIVTTDRWKTEALADALTHTNPYLGVIFCRTIRRVDKLEVDLAQRGFDCEKLHGDLSQNVRQRIMKSFKEGKFQYLITTDLASRGLDISGVSHIYNYDVPDTAETYIHRIGRTGRMGAKGVAITVISQKDEILVTEIETRLGAKIERKEFERPAGFIDRTHQQNDKL